MNFEFHGFLKEKKTLPPQSGLVGSSLVCMVFHAVQFGLVRSGPVSGPSPVQSGPVSSLGPVQSPVSVWGLVRSGPVRSGLVSGPVSGPVWSGRAEHQSYKRRHQSSPWCFFLMQNIDLLTCEQIANRHMFL